MKKENNLGWYKNYVIAFRNPLDMLSTHISGIIFDRVKNKVESFNFKIDPSQDPSLYNLNIKIIEIDVIIEDLPNNNFLVGGSFNKDSKKLEVNVKINKERFSDINYNNFSIGVRSTIRHELEHAKFQKDNPFHSPTYMEEEENDYLSLNKKIELASEYLNDESEINAIIRQCMTNAKFNKIDFLTHLSSMIWYFLYTRSGIYLSLKDIQLRINKGDQESVNMLFKFNNILNKYRKKALDIYPEAFNK